MISVVIAAALTLAKPGPDKAESTICDKNHSPPSSSWIAASTKNLAQNLHGKRTEMKFFGEIAVVIHLDEYRKTRAIRPAVQDCYGRERECIDGGAIATVSAIFCFQHPCELSPELPEDVTPVDLDKFLDRIHALASQF